MRPSLLIEAKPAARDFQPSHGVAVTVVIDEKHHRAMHRVEAVLGRPRQRRQQATEQQQAAQHWRSHRGFRG